MERKCPLCECGSVGRNWSRDITLGKKSDVDAAVFFNMTPAEVQEHLDKHEIVVDEETGDYNSPDFYMNKLLKLLKMLEDWLQYQILDGGLDKTKVELGIKLAREVRLTLESLAEFQGRLNRGGGDTTIKLTQINIKYMKLTQALMTEVCEECRPKIIEILDEQPREIAHP
jgi:hypothetical protein